MFTASTLEASETKKDEREKTVTEKRPLPGEKSANSKGCSFVRRVRDRRGKKRKHDALLAAITVIHNTTNCLNTFGEEHVYDLCRLRKEHCLSFQDKTSQTNSSQDAWILTKQFHQILPLLFVRKCICSTALLEA